MLYAAGNSGALSDSRTIGAPGTCKNCITVGATQLSDSLFRWMKPFVDQGHHCSLTTSGCCAATTDGTPRGLTCVQTSDTVSPCCSLVQNAKMSLACCPSQYTCSACSPPPSVESGNLRHAHNVATFSSRGTMFDDGRIKPDLVAPGEDILSAATPGVDGAGKLIPTDANFCGIPSATASRTATQSYNMALKLNSGTSMASPLAAGAIEKIRHSILCRGGTRQESLGLPQASTPILLCSVQSSLLPLSLSAAPAACGHPNLTKQVSAGSPSPTTPRYLTSLAALVCLFLIMLSPCQEARTGCFTLLERRRRHPPLHPLSL